MAGAAQGDRAARDARSSASRFRHRGRARPVRRHAGSGAVAGHGVAPRRSARARRDRACHRRVRQGVEQRPDREREPVGDDPSQPDHHAGRPAPIARGLLRPLLRHRRRPDLLWGRLPRRVPARRRLRRSHPQGREAGQPAAAGTNQVRTGDQPQDRQGARPHNADDAARHCRRGDRMIRREFIALLGGAAATWPLTARAQQPTKRVIGYLGMASPDLLASRLRAFRQGLGESGYSEGRNVAIEYRWADGQYDRIPGLIADLLRRQVTVIAAPGSTPAALAAMAVTSTTPIVFVTATDPVAAGLVASLSRPGGNLTGVAAMALELGPKQMELLHEAVPTATAIALLVNPTSRVVADTQASSLQATARTLGLAIHVLHASTAGDFDTVFSTLG